MTSPEHTDALAAVNARILADGEHLPQVRLRDGSTVQTGTVAAMLVNIARYDAGERGEVERALELAIPTLVKVGLFELFPPSEWRRGGSPGRAYVGARAEHHMDRGDDAARPACEPPGSAPPVVRLDAFVRSFAASVLAPWADLAPWALTSRSDAVVRRLLDGLDPGAYTVVDGVAVHHTATVEAGAVLKAPLIVGPGCRLAAGAYVRGGCWIDARCILGPGTELKSSFVFAGTALAHFNFVGDAVVGEGVNLEAGSIVCNHRNERADKDVRVRIDGVLHRTGHDKFGAVIGDQARIGANAVLAPGSLLPPASVVRRASLHDDEDGALQPPA